MQKSEKKEIFYGWFVVFAAFMTQFTVYSLVYNCFGLFIVPVSEALNVSKTAISTFYTILSIVGLGVTIFPVSQILDNPKIDIKWVMAAGCVFVGAGFVGASRVSSINQFYIMAVLVGIGLACAGLGTPIAVAINSWFIEKRGLALGITMAGSGVGSVILTQVITRVLAVYDWRSAFFIVGVITVVTTVPFILMFVTKYPEKKGYKPYGYKEGKLGDNQGLDLSPEELEKMSVANSIMTKNFWLFFFGYAALAFAMPAVKILLSPYLQDLSFSEQFAGNILSITAVVLIPGKPLIGMIFEKYGSKPGMILSGGFMTISIILLLINKLPLIYLFGAIYGLGSSVASVGPPIFISDIFKNNPNYAKIMSLASVGGGITGALGSTILTGLQEATNSYFLAWVTIAVLLVVATLLMSLSLKVNDKNTDLVGSKINIG